MHLMFGCNRHHCHLDGTPEIEIVQERGVVKVWGLLSAANEAEATR